MLPSDSSHTLIDLIRHGEPVGGKRYRGYGIDDPLSEKGWSQMWASVGTSHPWGSIVTSPLLRCRDFAAALSVRSGIPMTIDERFREVGFGSWEGRTSEEIMGSDPDGFQRFYEDPIHCRPEGAEALEDFYARVAHAYRDTRVRFAGDHVLIVAHAGVIRAVTTLVLDAPLESIYKQRIDNAAMVRVRHTPGGRDVLEGHNIRMG